MTLAQLPVDILCEIFKFLPVEDIVRLKRVSRTFNELAGRRIVWLDAYRLTTLPRPPGPYASQETDTLKRILVRSAKVERNWPHLDLNPADPHITAEGEARVYAPLSARQFYFSDILAAEAVGDRWIVVVNKSGIWCVDLESTEIPVGTKLYECASNCELSRPSLCLTTTDRGGCEVVYVVARVDGKGTYEENLIYIFKLHVHKHDGRKRYMTAELKASVSLGAGILSDAMLVHDLLLIRTTAYESPDRIWLLHTETDKVYQVKFPERWQPGDTWLPTVHLCSTHILVTYLRTHESDLVTGSRRYIDAYSLPTLPAVDSDTSHIWPQVQVQLSHTGVCPGHMISGPVLWECSNPRDWGGHAARVVLITHRKFSQETRVRCVTAVDLILHSSSEGVGAITYTVYDLFTPPIYPGSSSNSLYEPYGPVPQFFVTRGGSEHRGVIDYSRLILPLANNVIGFTISIEQQPDDRLCISFCAGRLQLPQVPHICFTVAFGGNTGRIVQQRYLSETRATLAVVDFA